MNSFAPFLQEKLNAPGLSLRARAMAAVSLFYKQIQFDHPDFHLDAFDGTVPGKSAKVHLLSPFAGHNAWAGIMWPLLASLSNARAALEIGKSLAAMQAPHGGIYLSTQENMDAGLVPQGDVSYAHTIEVHKAFRFLLEVTQSEDVRVALQRIGDLFRSTAFNHEKGFFDAGGTYTSIEEKTYVPTTAYASDVQLGVLLEFGPTFVDKNFGPEAAFRLWEKIKNISGCFEGGNLKGLGLVANVEISNAHAESTLSGALAARALAAYYPQHRVALMRDAETLSQGFSSFLVHENGAPVAVREALIEQKTWWGKILSIEPAVESTAYALMGIS